MYKNEVFEAEDLLAKNRNVVQSRSQRGKKCKIPIRFWIGCIVFVTTYINYTTRVNMSISIVSMTTGKTKAIPECKREEIMATSTHAAPAEGDATVAPQTPKPPPDYGPRYEWDEHVQGTILGSYFWGYVITSLPGGFIAEWLGPFHTIFWAHVIVSVFNVGCVFSPSLHWGVLVFCRFIIGLCAGPVYPALQCLIARWAPPSERGKFVSALMGNTLGTCITWPLVGTITQAFGWDWGFYVITIQIGVFLLIFWIVTADSPADHRWISEEEKNYIEESLGGAVTKTRAIPPYLSIFTSLPFWALQILHIGNLWGLYLQLTGVPKFMSEVVGFDLRSAGGLAALPHLMRLFFGTGYGSLGDFMKKKKVSTKFIRKFFVLLSHIIPGVLLIGISFIGCNWIPIVALLVFSQAINGAAVLTNLSNPQDLTPNFAGTVFGIISFVGGMTGFIVPQITGALTNEKNGVEEWGWNFIIGGCVYIACGIFFILFGSVEKQKWNEKKEDAGAAVKPEAS